MSSSPAYTDAFKTSSGRLKKVTTSYDQTRRRNNVWKKMSDLRRLEDVWFTSSWRRPIIDVLKTSDLRRLEDVWFTSSWRRSISDVLKTSDLWRLENARCTSSWKRPIYDTVKTSVKRRLCSNVEVASMKRWKIWFCLYFVLSEIFRKF